MHVKSPQSQYQTIAVSSLAVCDELFQASPAGVQPPGASVLHQVCGGIRGGGQWTSRL